MTNDVRTLLVVEDDVGLQKQLRWSFEDYEVVQAEDRPTALAMVRRFEPPVILQDLGLPPDPGGTEEGFASLNEILAIAPHSKVIVITGNGERDNAVRAVALGAYDFCTKPLDLDILRIIVMRAFRLHELEDENRKLRSGATSPLEGIIGASEAMMKVCRLVEKVGPTDATILLLGETGTGKELFARALHRLSGRSDGPFVAINCAAIPESLLEAELFGYERGAYTGAERQTRGKIELANRGTLLLDEIGDMPPTLQTKLLRFLQERTLERVGGREQIPVDVRIIAATHQDLTQLIATGGFREDFFYRISEVKVEVPPLRERPGDAALLAQHFLGRAASRHGRSVRGFTADALRAIETHEWKGNVRELENAVNSAVIMCEGAKIGESDIGLSDGTTKTELATLRQARAEAETMAIQRALSVADGKLSKAADLLGITRPTLYDLMEKLGVQRPQTAE